VTVLVPGIKVKKQTCLVTHHYCYCSFRFTVPEFTPGYSKGEHLGDTAAGFYVAAKATYIRLLHGKIGFLGFFSALAP